MTKTNLDEARIRETAYLLWLDDGRPDGRDREHWLKAIDALTPAQPKAKTARKAPAKPRATKVKTAPATKAAAKTESAAKAKTEKKTASARKPRATKSVKQTAS